jgi:hypothetical protein
MPVLQLFGEALSVVLRSGTDGSGGLVNVERPTLTAIGFSTMPILYQESAISYH